MQLNQLNQEIQVTTVMEIQVVVSEHQVTDQAAAVAAAVVQVEPEEIVEDNKPAVTVE
jgi:hypothetical protein